MEYDDYRNIELSILTAFQDGMPDIVNVTLEELEEPMEMPSVGIHMLMIDYVPFEMGNKSDNDYINWGVAIYSNTKQERDYLTIFIYSKLKDWSTSLYDYSQDPAPVIGEIHYSNPSAEPVRNPRDPTDKLLYTSLVTFKINYSQEE